jgi:hypothetical protein
MTGDCDIYDLVLEMLYVIAAVDEQSYKAMLAVPLFARSLTPDKVVDFMIAFGYSVEITKNHIGWYLNGKRHRPALEWANGYKRWYLNGIRQWGVLEMVRYNR